MALLKLLYYLTFKSMNMNTKLILLHYGKGDILI